MDCKNISDADLDIINESLRFFFYYYYGTDVIDVLDIKKAARCKKAMLNYLGGRVAELSEESRTFFDKDRSATDFLEFLLASEKEYEIRQEQRKQNFYEQFSDLPDMTVDALWKMVCYGIVPLAKRGEHYEAMIEELSTCRFSLLVESLEVPAEYNLDEVEFEVIDLSRDEIRFCLHCKVIDYERDTIEERKIYFFNPVTEIVVLNGCRNWSEPWENLSVIADSIVKKSELLLSLCNEKEIELLPVLKELSNLDCLSEDTLAFPILKKIASRYGFYKIVRTLERVEGAQIKTFKDRLSLSKTLSIMNMATYEPMWRELYQKIEDSQKEYPKYSEVMVPQAELQKIRKGIEARFLSEGYHGKYPNFYKEGTMKGLHLAHSFGTSYFVGLQRDVKYFIHCIEDYEDTFYMSFVSGTDLNKKNPCKDICSCMFNDNGRRLYNITTFTQESDDLTLSASIAMKRAECRPLSKYEKEQEFGRGTYSVLEFLWYLLFAGGLFSIGFNLLYPPVMYGIMWLTGEREGFIEFMSKIPWLFMLLSAWIGFGGVFGLCEILSKRK